MAELCGVGEISGFVVSDIDALLFHLFWWWIRYACLWIHALVCDVCVWFILSRSHIESTIDEWWCMFVDSITSWWPSVLVCSVMTMLIHDETCVLLMIVDLLVCYDDSVRTVIICWTCVWAIQRRVDSNLCDTCTCTYVMKCMIHVVYILLLFQYVTSTLNVTFYPIGTSSGSTIG
jgi:hypothetical protein